MKLELVVDQLKKHIYQYSAHYIFVVVLFLMGVVFGSILVNSLSYAQKNDLYEYLNHFFFYVSTEELITFKELFSQSFIHHLKHLALFFVLGITIIGMPIVLILLFLKGIVVGFTVGFLVNQLNFQGFLLALFSIFPQNLIIVPVFLLASVLSISFSIQLVKKIVSNNPNLIFWPIGLKYLQGFSVLIVFIVIGACLEAVLSINLLKTLLNLV